MDSNRLEKIEAMLVDDPGDTFLRYSRAMELAKLGRTTEGIDSLKELVNRKVSNDEFENAKKRFPFQTPQNKEEYYYRSIFEEHFPSKTDL